MLATSKNNTKFKTFAELNPRARSPRAAIENCLWKFNYANGYYTTSGKRLDPPKSKKYASLCMQRGWYQNIPAIKWKKHFANMQILYGYNSPNISAKYMLWMIDIDPLDGADITEFVKILVAELKALGIKVYWEKSPSGGWHGYFFVDKHGTGEICNQSLDSFDRFLKSIVLKHGWDDRIKECTVKGKMPDIDWPTKTVEKQYALFQLPKEVTTRKDDFFAASVVPESFFRKVSFRKQTSEYIKASGVKPKIRQGSTGMNYVNQDDMDMLPTYARMAERLDLPDIVCQNRSKVTREDWSILFMVLFVLARYPNEDGSRPMTSIDQIWTRLYSYGYIDRQYSKSRLACMRKYLGKEAGLIEYQDRNYHVGYKNKNGEYQEGYAAKWGLNADAFIELELSVDSMKQQGGESLCNIITRQIHHSSLSQDLIRNMLTPEIILSINEFRADKLVGYYPIAA